MRAVFWEVYGSKIVHFGVLSWKKQRSNLGSCGIRDLDRTSLYCDVDFCLVTDDFCGCPLVSVHITQENKHVATSILFKSGCVPSVVLDTHTKVDTTVRTFATFDQDARPNVFLFQGGVRGNDTKTVCVSLARHPLVLGLGSW
jgi:hypothetical protein